MLKLALDWLDVDYSVWHNVQLEAVLLKSIMPADQIPDVAIIDFLVAISVLPVAVFTTISVLGGAHDMPDWMHDPEEKIENLNQNLLEEDATPEVGDDGDGDDSDPLAEFGAWKRTTGAEDEEESDSALAEEDESNRMIDLPFGLFDD
jgi:hypothetical protein